MSHRKEWNSSNYSNVDGPKDYHIKWSKPYRERQIPYDTAYMWNLKRKQKRYKWIFKFFYKTETDPLKTNLWLPKEKGGGGRYKLGGWD